MDTPLFRQIHMDFHTPPGVKVGDKFEAVKFFDTLEAAKVNSLAFFAKCHHGYSYFDTKIGTRHPGLEFDLLGKVSEEARKRKMPLLVYFSLNVDEVFAEAHPEHVAQFKDGTPVDTQILQDGSELYWRWLCPNRGDWLHSFFFPHVQECLNAYPMDGIFIDMAGYLPGSCFCENCLAAMREQGINPDDETVHNQFNSVTHHRFAEELRRRLDAFRQGMRLEIGCYCAFGEAAKAKGVISEFYSETLAFQTGWFAFPFMGRYLSNTGVPVMGITGRFLKNWGDFGTIVSPLQLKVQLAEHLTVGASSCVGDHLHCDGHLDKGVYDTIGEAYSFIEERQPYCVGLERAREVAILVPAGVESAAMVCGKQSGPSLFDKLYGAEKFLMEEHAQWDVVDSTMSWDGLRALVVAKTPMNDAELEKLERFVSDGGALLVDSGAVIPAPFLRERWFALLGIEEAGPSEFPGSFYVPGKQLAKGIPEMAHYVHEAGLTLRSAPESVVWAQARVSPFPRNREHFYGHFHGPDAQDTGPAVTAARGGRVIVFAQPLFAAYLMTGYHVHKTLLSNVLRRILPKRIVTTNAPSQMEITVGRKDGRTVVQLLPFITDRRHRHSFESINEQIPIGGFTITLATGAPVTRIHDPISGKELKFTMTKNGVRFRPRPVAGHTLLLVEDTTRC